MRFATNSWGGKYDLPDDATVGDDVARAAGLEIVRHPFVLEGGAIDQDGEGTILTTRQTLLNPNRNGWSKEQAEAALADAFGAKKIIWIDEGLKNDHTDGHIDNIARFVAPGRVVCQAPAGPDDPNAETLDAIARTLEASTDASGRKLDVVRIPGVGLYRNTARRNLPRLAYEFHHRQRGCRRSGLRYADAGSRLGSAAQRFSGPQGRRRQLQRAVGLG